MFTINENSLDRTLRFYVGVFLLYASTLLFGVWQWVFGASGALLLLMGIIGFSPLYHLIGVNTLNS